ncbi:hypothetical protein lbkm_1928 [Lachnospiraceae bacterium KM106-2]|nr:hypothetical protein lbkm_1928 [Lachnospiraceae bacterium KM106-2]
MTPREPAERKGEGVFTKSGMDVTEAYLKGADEMLKLAKLYDCKVVIMKENSPSCGAGKIYDGTFTGKVTDGNGVATETLMEHGIMVIAESKVRDYFQLV